MAAAAALADVTPPGLSSNQAGRTLFGGAAAQPLRTAAQLSLEDTAPTDEEELEGENAMIGFALLTLDELLGGATWRASAGRSKAELLVARARAVKGLASAAPAPAGSKRTAVEQAPEKRKLNKRLNEAQETAAIGYATNATLRAASEEASFRSAMEDCRRRPSPSPPSPSLPTRAVGAPRACQQCTRVGPRPVAPASHPPPGWRASGTGGRRCGRCWPASAWARRWQ